jgi:alpha-tubulin suppressor-like RCC1 family protein
MHISRPLPPRTFPRGDHRHAPGRPRAHSPRFILILTAILAALAVVPAAAGAAVPAGACDPATPGAGQVLAWGEDTYFQLGPDYKAPTEHSPVGVVAGPNSLAGLTGVKAVGTGASSSFALMGDCTVKAWGGNTKGQLGDESRETSQTPVDVKALYDPATGASGQFTDVREIIPVNAHVIALRNDGTVWTWGAAEYGERGNGEKEFIGTATVRSEPTVRRDLAVQVPDLKDVVQVAGGGHHDFALTSHGEVYAWGEDKQEEMGVPANATCTGEEGPRPCVTRPEKVEGLTHVAAISVGEESAYAMVPEGELMTVKAWGGNARGQLGDGSTEASPRPVTVQGLPASPRVVEVSSGDRHVLARLADGSVYSWGVDKERELGRPVTEECAKNLCGKTAGKVNVLTGVEQVSAGKAYSLALSKGRAYGFGNNVLGQLGIASGLDMIAQPTLVKAVGAVSEPATSIAGIAAGTNHSVAFLRAGMPTPTSRFRAQSGSGSLRVSWSSVPPVLGLGTEYKLRWHKAATREEHMLSFIESCPPNAPCSTTIPGLEPGRSYEVLLRVVEFGRVEAKLLFATPAP